MYCEDASTGTKKKRAAADAFTSHAVCDLSCEVLKKTEEVERMSSLEDDGV